MKINNFNNYINDYHNIIKKVDPITLENYYQAKKYNKKIRVKSGYSVMEEVMQLQVT